MIAFAACRAEIVVWVADLREHTNRKRQLQRRAEHRRRPRHGFTDGFSVVVSRSEASIQVLRSGESERSSYSWSRPCQSPLKIVAPRNLTTRPRPHHHVAHLGSLAPCCIKLSQQHQSPSETQTRHTSHVEAAFSHVTQSIVPTSVTSGHASHPSPKPPPSGYL